MKRTARSWAQRLRLALLILLMSPVWLVMIFTGFPPPLPPWQRQRPPQTQSQPGQQQRARREAGSARLPR